MTDYVLLLYAWDNVSSSTTSNKITISPNVSTSLFNNSIITYNQEKEYGLSIPFPFIRLLVQNKSDNLLYPFNNYNLNYNSLTIPYTFTIFVEIENNNLNLELKMRFTDAISRNTNVFATNGYLDSSGVFTSVEDSEQYNNQGIGVPISNFNVENILYDQTNNPFNNNNLTYLGGNLQASCVRLDIIVNNLFDNPDPKPEPEPEPETEPAPEPKPEHEPCPAPTT